MGTVSQQEPWDTQRQTLPELGVRAGMRFCLKESDGWAHPRGVSGPVRKTQTFFLGKIKWDLFSVKKKCIF